MKLSKKVVAAMSTAALLVTASFFTSCTDDEEAAFSGKKVNFNNSYVTTTTATDGTVTVNHAEADTSGAVKNTLYFYRAFNKLATKHEGSTCTITLTPQNDGLADATRKADGVAGFVFDMNDGTDDTYNFIVAAVSYNTETNNVGTYISKFTNAKVKDNNFVAASSFVDKDGTEITTTENANGAKEVEIVTGNTTGSTQFGTGTVYYGFPASTFATDENGNIVVVVKVTQDKTSGDYAVEYYKTAEDAKSTTTDPVKSFTVADANTLTEGCKQAKMAMYANVYPGKHLVADFDFTDTVGNAIPFEDEVVED